MKLPNLDNADAMQTIGKRAVLHSALLDSKNALRDAMTRVQGADWASVAPTAAEVEEQAKYIQALAVMWEQVK